MQELTPEQQIQFEDELEEDAEPVCYINITEGGRSANSLLYEVKKIVGGDGKEKIPAERLCEITARSAKKLQMDSTIGLGSGTVPEAIYPCVQGDKRVTLPEYENPGNRDLKVKHLRDTSKDVRDDDGNIIKFGPRIKMSAEDPPTVNVMIRKAIMSSLASRPVAAARSAP